MKLFKNNKTIPIIVGMVLVYFIALSVVLRMFLAGAVKETQEETSKAAETEQNGLKNIQVGDIVTLGVYEQDSILDNGKEPIEWDVVAEKDGKYLLLSHYVLDSYRYDDEKSFDVFFANQELVDSFVTWEKSSLRAYLNNNFYNTAFTEEEKKYICLTTNTTGDWAEINDGRLGATNVKTGGLGGEDTQDYVFLLSIEEIRKYFSDSRFEHENLVAYIFYSDLLVSPTLYAIDRGVVTSAPDEFYGGQTYMYTNTIVQLDENGYDLNDVYFWNKYYAGKIAQDYVDFGYFTNWGLRSPGCFNNVASYLFVCENGSIRTTEQNTYNIGIRPAMWIKAVD